MLTAEDLAETITTLAAEHDALQTALAQIGKDRAKTAQSFKDVLGPSITSTDGNLSGLSEQRSEIAGILALYEQFHRLEAIEQVVPTPTPKTKGENTFATLPRNAYEQFATMVENILREWSFPELERVVFDTKAEDIVISGKARKDNGKGYRAITYAAHPGFVLMDSPLVTYREPNEHMGEGVKDAFYRNLAITPGDAQVIALENEQPPAQIIRQIAFTGFTKNPTIGRYGSSRPCHRNNLFKRGTALKIVGGNPYVGMLGEISSDRTASGGVHREVSRWPERIVPRGSGASRQS